MEVVVLRPAGAADRTAAELRARGHAPLVAPLSAIVAAPPEALANRDWAGVVVTSAAAIEAVAGHADLPALACLPLWAVGSHSAAVARRHGFADVREGGGDAAALVAHLRGEAERGRPFLWLAGADIAADLPVLLAPDGIVVDRRVVYRAETVAALPAALAAALRAGTPAAVLHFSPRGAATYRDLATRADLLDAALRPAQLCLAEAVATPLRAAGAAHVAVAERPDQAALLALLGSPTPPRAVR